jgi:putative aldouronate transport system permease protein
VVDVSATLDTGSGSTTPSHIREAASDRIFLVGIYVFLGVVLLMVLYPLIYVVSSSFSSVRAVQAGEVWLLPIEPTLAGYEAVAKHPGVLLGYMNSAIYAFFGTLVNVILTVMLAYPLSRRTFYGRKLITLALVFTLMFNGGLIPLYLTVRELGILNTRLAMIIPQALAVWQVLIARTFFFSTIPDELVEAAEIDDCSDLYFVWSVVLPLSKPIIAVLVLLYAVFHWNAYFDALIYLNNEKLFPLQIVLRQLLILNQAREAAMRVTEAMQREGLADLLKFSLIIVATLPVMVLYPFAQKHFIKGIMIGSVKG